MRQIRAIRVAVRALRALIVLLLIGTAYLSLVGFPGVAIRRIESRIASAGVDIRLDRLCLDYRHGLRADGVRWFMTDKDRYPAWESPHVYLSLDWRAWLQGQPLWSRVSGGNGRFLMSLTGPLLSPDDEDVVSIRDVRFDVRRAGDGIRIESIQAWLNNIEIVGRGYVQPDLGKERSADAESRDWSEALRANVHLMAWLRDIRDAEPEVSARFSFDFMLHPAQSAWPRVQADFSSGRIRFRGLLFDEMLLEVFLRNNAVEVPVLKLRHGEHVLKGEGYADQLSHQAWLKMASDLPPAYLRNMMPGELQDQFDRARIQLIGDLQFELEAGPARIEEWMSHLRITARAKKVNIQGAWFEQLNLIATFEKDQVILDNISFETGKIPEDGQGEGRFRYNLPNRTFAGTLRARLNPGDILPLAAYSRNAADVIQSLSFSSGLPAVEAAFSGRAGEEPSFHMEAVLQGENFVFRGASIDAFSAGLTLTNQVLRLNDMRVVRPEGEASGDLELDFAREVASFDLTSGLNPRALGRMAGPKTERLLRPFHFNGPVDLTAEGQLDYGSSASTSYRATALAWEAGWGYFTADRIQADWIAEGSSVWMTNLNVTLYGGHATGFIRMEGLDEPSPAYNAMVDIQTISFADVLRQASQVDDVDRKGQLSVNLKVSGLAEDDWKASVQGEGTLSINDGEVFRIPLMGGLSRLLSRIYTGFGFATQTDVLASFTMGNRRIETQDIRMEGYILSLYGWGAYELDDYLDFRVQVQPLKRGLLVDAVRIVTYPVSRLLQFRLQGTLSEPVWHVESLPSELWRLFEGETGK